MNAPHHSALPAPETNTGLRILAVDDIHANLFVLAHQLRSLGHHPCTANNGAEALRLIGAERFDVLMVDLQMPDIDGATVIAELLRLYPDESRRPRIIAFSAHSVPKDATRAVDEHIDDYLEKPATTQDVRASLARTLALDRSDAAVTSRATAPWHLTPIIELKYLKQAFTGFSDTQFAAVLRELHERAKLDCVQGAESLKLACAERDASALAATVHGLKGCFKTVGWTRAGARCETALAELRRGEFQQWETFAAELDQLLAESNSEVVAFIAQIQPEKDRPTAP